jgi:hypothetical protein
VKRALSLILIGCFLSSCATMTRGRDEVITVDSNPSGANATISCAGNVSASGTTPARLTIPRNSQSCLVRIEKAGAQSQSIKLQRGINGRYWLNFVYAAGIPIGAILAFGGHNDTQGAAGAVIGVGSVPLGIGGLIVDRATGAMFDHDPNVIKVTLQPQH